MKKNKSSITFSNMITMIFKILFTVMILLILINAIPWLFPIADISKSLLVMQGVFQYIQPLHSNINAFMSTLSPIGRIFGLLASVLKLLPLLLGIIIMIRLSKDYSLGKIFNLVNARRYRNLGILYLANSLIIQPISQILFSLCFTINNPVGKRVIGFGVDLSTITAIFFASILIIIGQVMKLAYKVNKEQELTI